jgi:cation:H+ antiporter
MEVIGLFVIFFLSLAVLVKASDFFTEAAEKIGILLGLSPFIVGVTIVAAGTSLPELISSIVAVFQNSSEIVVANVVGSNIANIFLILGTAAVVSLGKSKEINIGYDLVSVDLPLFVGSAFLLGLTIWDQDFSRVEAGILVVGYIMYLFYTIQSSGIDADSPDSAAPSDDRPQDPPSSPEETTSLSRQLLVVVISALFIFLGANYTIDSLIKISDLLQIGKEIIAVSAVAVGTSLPELIVTINAALKGKADVAIGNVLGSNIFNIFMVMGIPGLLRPLTIPDSVITGGLPVLIAGTLLMFFVTQDKKLTIWEGWMFFIFYFWFIAKTFNLA